MGAGVLNKFTQRFGDHIRIYEGWGSTESNCSLSNLENIPGSCGRIPFWDKTFMRMVRYSVENEAHERDQQGFCIEAKPQQVGELLGQVHDAQGNIVSPFDGYSDDAATSKKLLHDVFEKGDCWFSTGDLFRYDEEGYFFFVDRIGDTFRWKSENVSTTEVAHQLSAYQDAELINVYGVQVPNTEGRAGMAAVGMVEGKAFDPKAFYTIATQNLPAYATPLFIRIVQEMDITGTFKLRKIDLQQQGYDPDRVDGPLFVLDHQQKSYSPYSEQGLQALGVSQFK
jgi:fatty-acyl-CoA synthase